MTPDNCALILPSSVYPAARLTVLSDPEERARQYIDALSWYIRETSLKKIIVCDNTGYNYPSSVQQLAAACDKRLEILSFSGDVTAVENYGKGYGEGEIMEYTMKHSLLLQEVEGFIKATGRLKVININKIVQRIDGAENYFMPVSLLRPRFLVPRAARPCVEVRVYYVTRTFFNEVLLTAYKTVRDNETFFLEHAYHQAIARSLRFIEKVKCFPVAPEITGMSGSNGWIFKERSRPKKVLIRLVSHLGYIRPIW